MAEIINLGNQPNLEEEYQKAMDRLIENGTCFQHQEFYSIQSRVNELSLQRELKEKEAKKYLKKLPFFVGLVSMFPFVRGIAISGSLSKGVMYKDGDIDYFIVTAPERLWICRTMLVLFKKLFLLNSKK